MRRSQLLLIMLLLTVSITGACRPMIDPTAGYPTLQLRGHVAGPALTVAVQGDYAYLGFSYELVVLDITDRANPQVGDSVAFADQ
jgi:hypothetical protein